jgi:UDP-3-O-[3-hydroxymyristoyl] glucosamine N-acyltransferase
MKLSDIARKVGGNLEGGDLDITGINTLLEAQPGQITFLSNPRYAKFVADTSASAIILDRKFECPTPLSIIRTDDPYLATLLTVRIFYPRPEPEIIGIHPSAIIAESAKLGSGVAVAPGAVIGQKVQLGHRVKVGAKVVIEDNVQIGDDTIIHSGAVIRHSVIIGKRVIIHPGAVIGAEGFGFAPVGDKYEKIPQVGTVIIEDDADIGANTCIDRAFLGATRIGQGVKLDNLIQVGHNVEIGPHTVIAGQTGISGSTVIGKGVMIGGQVGIVGHIEISDGMKIGAQSGVTKTFPPGTTIFGYPARPIMETKRIEASLRKLPELTKKITDLENKLKELFANKK